MENTGTPQDDFNYNVSHSEDYVKTGESAEESGITEDEALDRESDREREKDVQAVEKDLDRLENNFGQGGLNY